MRLVVIGLDRRARRFQVRTNTTRIDFDDFCVAVSPLPSDQINSLSSGKIDYGIRPTEWRILNRLGIGRKPAKERQGGKRLGTPTRLDVKQLRALLEALPARERLMVLLDFGTGLRRGELSGVKWQDMDFEEKVLTPMRSIVKSLRWKQ